MAWNQQALRRLTPAAGPLEDVMFHYGSFLEKITDRVKDIASIAADAANYALAAEEPPVKADQKTAACMPLARKKKSAAARQADRKSPASTSKKAA